MSFSEDLDFDLKEYMKPDTKKDSAFDSLSFDEKLSKLQLLVQKSQLYSQIILDNMLERSIEKKKIAEERRAAAKNQESVSSQESAHNEDEKEENAKAGNDVLKKEDEDRVVEVHSDSDVEIIEVRHSSRLGNSSRRSQRVARKPKKVKKHEKKVEQKIKSKVSAETERMRKAIEAAQTGHNQQQPALVTGCVMKDYQLDGLEWLASLYENGLNGILADEMGLGKTLQCIALFSYLIENNVDGPFLVVAPLSTIRNWGSEFRKFAPDIEVVEYVGTKDERRKKTMSNRMKHSVIVTSYEIIIKDFRRFSRISWAYLTVDEGHRLKNFQSILIQFLRKLHTGNRLLLTGTPLQNDLKELWSLLNFILPDIFHDLELFEKWFNFDDLANSETETSEELKKAMNEKLQKEIVKSLHTVLKPFLLRRVKKDVIKDLPPKKEYIIYSDLQPLQQAIYNACITKNLPEKLVETNVKEYLITNEPELFSTEEDLCFVDQALEKLRSRKSNTANKRGRVNYSEMKHDKDLYMAIGENASDEAEEEQDGPKQEEVEEEHSNEEHKMGKVLNEAAILSDAELNKKISDELRSNNNAQEAQISLQQRLDKRLADGIGNGQKFKEEDEDSNRSDTESGKELNEFENTIETRETSIEAPPVKNGRKRPRQVLQDECSSDIEIIEDPKTQISKTKQQFIMILKAYRLAEQRVRHLNLKNRLMSLRNICGSHYSYYYPFPIDHEDSDKYDEKFAELILRHSGKVQLLEQLLERLLKDNHKTLIFSQFTSALDVIALRLEAIGVPISRIDGRYSIDVRKDEIDQFCGKNEESSKVFLISTRAGGLGLNLIEADTVILFDSDWNPQMDLQAIDRVHRIGQTKPVKIFRFVSRNTIEEIVIMRSFGKRALEQLVIRLGDFQLSRVAKKLAEENIDVMKIDTSKNLLSLGERLNVHGLNLLGKIPSVNQALLQKVDPKRPKLLPEEMEELMDRSDECFSRESKEYPNVTSFESSNN